MIISFHKLLILLAALLSVSACKPLDFKTINENPEKHFKTHFTVGSLPDSIQNSVNSSHRASKAKHSIVRIEQDATTTKAIDQTVSSQTINTDIERLGNGLFRETQTLLSNGIPHITKMNINYSRLLYLKNQTIYTYNRYAGRIGEVKQFKSFDFDFNNMLPNKKYTASYLTGLDIQIANYTEQQVECEKTGSVIAAAIYKKLVGNAFELTCSYSRDNIINTKSKYWYLESYGQAILKEANTAALATKYKINKIIAQ